MSMNNGLSVPYIQKFLSEQDFAALLTFCQQCDDSEADGYTVNKETMKRLAELGAVRWLGFSRYEVTSFGSWLIETEFEQSSALPLRTAAEWNEISKRNGLSAPDPFTVAVDAGALEALRSAMSKLRAPMSRTEYAAARACIIEAVYRLLAGGDK